MRELIRPFAAALCVLALASPAFAAAVVLDPAARAKAGAALPNWSGIWVIAGAPTNTTTFDGATADPPGSDAITPGVRQHPPYNAEWEARYVAAIKRSAAGLLPDPLTLCLPRGTPGNMRSPDQYEFIVTPSQVWISIENGSQLRRIWTDGREHLKGDELFATFTGDSVGRWEGDTLVVDTIGLKPDMIIDRTGATLSEKAHIVERIRRIDANTMEDRFTIEDPVALTRPWTVTRRYKPSGPGARIFDYACSENNRNPIDEEGRTRTLDASGKLLD
jgi:hypothetical protein